MKKQATDPKRSALRYYLVNVMPVPKRHRNGEVYSCRSFKILAVAPRKQVAEEAAVAQVLYAFLRSDHADRWNELSDFKITKSQQIKVDAFIKAVGKKPSNQKQRNPI